MLPRKCVYFRILGGDCCLLLKEQYFGSTLEVVIKNEYSIYAHLFEKM